MNPTMISTTLLLLIGAVNGDGTIVTVEQSITPSFSNGDIVDGIEVNCDDTDDANCRVDDDKWFLSADKSDKIEDWAIEVDLSGAFALSSGLSSISFTIDGERVNSEADMFMGFGDGDQYISFSTDFDGSMSSGYYSGVIVYPPCGSPLAAGSVSDILSNSQQYASNAGIAVRHALAGGDRSEWKQFGGERHNNGNSWPVTIEIVNDEDEDTVTLRFISENSGDADLSAGSIECVYTGTFGTSEFTFGILPDLGNGNKDNFHIDSIDIEVASTVDGIYVAGPQTPVRYSDPVGHVVISDNMHLEMDVFIQSVPTVWSNLFAGNQGRGQGSYPSVLVTPVGKLFVVFKSSKVYTESAVELNRWYHLEMDVTQTTFRVTLDDQVVVETDKSAHDTIEDMPCYIGNNWHAAADAQVKNLYYYSVSDASQNAAAHSMSVEGDNGSDHDAAQKPVDDMNPIALTLIGAVVVVVIFLLFVVMRGRTKKEQTAKESVAEMSEVVDAPKVVHAVDDTVEVPTETAVAEQSIPETTVNGMEEAVEVKVNTETA